MVQGLRSENAGVNGAWPEAPWSKVVDKRSKGGKKSKTSLSTLSDVWGGLSLRELPELMSKPDSGVIAALASGRLMEPSRQRARQ